MFQLMAVGTFNLYLMVKKFSQYFIPAIAGWVYYLMMEP